MNLRVACPTQLRERLDSGVALSDTVEQRRWMDEHPVTERPTGSSLSTGDPHYIL